LTEREVEKGETEDDTTGSEAAAERVDEVRSPGHGVVVLMEGVGGRKVEVGADGEYDGFGYVGQNVSFRRRFGCW